MRTATMTTPSSQDCRQGFFLHRIQKGYAVWIGVILFLYSALFFTLAFYGPHLGPMLTLYGGGTLEERQAAASEMLLLSETVAVAVPVLFLGAVVFSLVLTRRVAGPLFQLDRSIQEWARGNLSWRMEFRKSDRLDDLAETANQALAKVEHAFGELHRQNSAIQAAVTQWSSGKPESAQDVQQATEAISKVLGKFTYRSVR